MTNGSVEKVERAKMSQAIHSYRLPPQRTQPGVSADLDVDAGGPYKAGEVVEVIGGSNIQVDAGEPAGRYQFVIYILCLNDRNQAVYKQANSYPVVSDGQSVAGYSPVIAGSIYNLGPGKYSLSAAITVLKPNIAVEVELARKTVAFSIT